MSMNLNSFGSHLPESYEEGIEDRFFGALVLSVKDSEDEDDLENDEIQIALAQSRAENEVEMARAAVDELLEEEDMVKAISESEASFQEEREIRDLLRVSEQINNEAMMGQQGYPVTMAPSIEVQEQMLEWLQDQPDSVDNVFLPIDEYEGEELPVLYKNYRLVPTLFLESEMWPPAAIQKQLTELQFNRRSEEVREWQDNQSENDRCVVCLTNVATRVAVPCGHRLSCRPCLSSLVRQDNYYTVTAADGQVLPTDRHMPILCYTCRSIVGQIVTIH